ncbi:MAG: MFS transporter [Gemmatimonadaceae bacterium]|nr:MFS transporter [Gemmatimonadaceae bacterium]
MSTTTPTPTSDRRGDAWGLALLLFLANTLSFVDRQVLTLLVKPLRAELGISDVQVSLLQGLAFASLYAVLGLPLGRLADRVHRARLMAAGVALWSTMTIASAVAPSYPQLFLARMGVAVGEAALAPAAVSLLSDRFARARTGRAIAVFQAGIFTGSALALLAGGWLLAAVDAGGMPWLQSLGITTPWRAVFLVVGLPGWIIAPLLLLVHEPRTGAIAAGASQLSVGRVVGWVWARRTVYGGVITAFTAITILAYGSMAWAPTVLVRLHALTSASAGIRLGIITLIAGPFGVVTGGWLVDRLVARGRADAPIIGALAGVIVFALVVPAFALASSLTMATIAAVALSLAQSYPYGIASTSLAMVTPPAMRGQVVALYLLISNLLGLTLGPLLVALGTQQVFGDDLAVGRSLALLPILTMPIAFASLLASRVSYARAWRASDR